MAVFPAIGTYAFCDYILNTAYVKITPPRKVVVQAVQVAAGAATSVSDNDWYNFLLSTNDFYLGWLEQSAFNPNAVYDSAAVAYFVALTTPLSYAFKQYVNQFIIQLKADGNFTKLDRLWLHATEAQDQAKVSIVNPASTKLTEVGSPTWTAKQGYTGNGSSMYLNTNYNLSTSSLNYLLNSSSAGLYIRTNPGAAVEVDLGVADATPNLTYLFPRNVGDNSFQNAQAALAGIFTYANADTRGFFSIIRTAANAQSAWKNGISKATNATASSVLINNNVYILANNNNGAAASFSRKQIALSYFGSGTVGQLTFYNAIQTLMTQIGANV